jgi:hypothetical protein
VADAGRFDGMIEDLAAKAVVRLANGKPPAIAQTLANYGVTEPADRAMVEATYCSRHWRRICARGGRPRAIRAGTRRCSPPLTVSRGRRRRTSRGRVRRRAGGSGRMARARGRAARLAGRRWRPACQTRRRDTLRHSFCSLLLHEGRSVIYVARQLGHDAQMTLSTYGHVIDELDEAPRMPAEQAIREARSGACVNGVPREENP